MTEEREAEIEARLQTLAAYRPEHWRVEGHASGLWRLTYSRDADEDPDDDRFRYDLLEDPPLEVVACFAATPGMLRDLLAEVRRLRAEPEEWEPDLPALSHEQRMELIRRQDRTQHEFLRGCAQMRAGRADRQETQVDEWDYPEVTESPEVAAACREMARTMPVGRPSGDYTEEDLRAF